ncbi:MAG: peptidoglycan editing factor PgeF [Desulfobulbales bacterium]|nr:peptidoglycan editing factor PgeF [Desulfobulbales bacterium]
MPETNGFTISGNTLYCQAFPPDAVFHAVFNRTGGVSVSPWDSNNVSHGLGDDPENVRRNRARIKQALGIDHMASARQVHGSEVCHLVEKPAADFEADGYDALITNIAGVGLMIQQADCQAVMLFDPENMAVAIVHAGWRGTVAEIIARTVAAMGRAFATQPSALLAAISPSLGPCCAEFINYRSELPAALHSYQVRPNYFDFWAISRDQLRAAGVQPENIHIAGICTCCSDDYFSYRRDRHTGRFASVLGIREAAG